MNYIEAKVKFEKTMDNGARKVVTEHYMVDAMSFTEAEARVAAEVAPYIKGEFSVSAVKKSNIGEVFQDIESDAVSWYKIKAEFIIINEKTGKEKRKACHFLVQGKTCEGAIAHFRHTINMMADYDITAVQLSPILEVFAHVPQAAVQKEDAE